MSGFYGLLIVRFEPKVDVTSVQNEICDRVPFRSDCLSICAKFHVDSITGVVYEEMYRHEHVNRFGP